MSVPLTDRDLRSLSKKESGKRKKGFGVQSLECLKNGEEFVCREFELQR